MFDVGVGLMTPFTAQNGGRFSIGRARSPGGVKLPEATASADVIVVSASLTNLSAEQSAASAGAAASSAAPAARTNKRTLISVCSSSTSVLTAYSTGSRLEPHLYLARHPMRSPLADLLDFLPAELSDFGPV